MTYQEANHISIKDYLKSLGILPAVDKYYYGMYHIMPVLCQDGYAGSGGLRCKSVV